MSLYDGTNGPLIKVYIDNAGLTPSAFVLGVSTLASGSSNISLSGTGNGTSITFSLTNTFTVGQTVRVTGFGISTGVSLNGTYIISSRTSSTFTVLSTKVGTTSGSGNCVVGDQLTTNTPYTSLVQIPSTDVRGISIRRGRTREDQTFQPGTMTLELDNWSGVYDPQMLNSTWSFNGYSFFTAGRPMRVTATWSGTEYTLYSGYIEQIDIDQTLNPIVTITCVDILKQLGIVNVSGTFGFKKAVPGILFTYTNSGEVAGIIARAANIPGTTGVGGAGGAYQLIMNNVSGTALSLLENLVALQGGRVYAAKDGSIYFDGYDGIVPGSTSLTLSDQRTTGTIEYDDISITPGSKYLLNQVILNNQDGTYNSTYTNSYSAQQNGLVTKTLTTYNTYTGSGPAWSTPFQYLADHFASNAYRVDSLSFNVMNLNGFGGSVWASFLNLELGQRVSVARTPVYTTATTYDCLVQSINHDITPDNWRVSLNLSPAN